MKPYIAVALNAISPAKSQSSRVRVAHFWCVSRLPATWRISHAFSRSI